MLRLLRERLQRHRLALGVLLGLPLLLFYSVLHYDFSPMDEQWLILRRFDYLNTWSTLLSAFKDQVAQTYYRPLLTVSFVVDAHTGGLRPFAWHLSNVLLHAACCLLLYRLLLLFNTSRQTALLLALLFCVHPALVHAVVWIPGRNDVLLTLFALLSFIALLHYCEYKKTIWLAAHLLAFGAALLSKESAVILPLVYCSLLWYKQQTFKIALLPAAAWVVLAAGWYLAKTAVLPKVSVPLPAQPLATVLNMLQALMVYTGNALWPVHPSVTPTVGNSSVLAGLVAVVLLAVLVLFVGVRNKKAALAGAIVFYGCLLLPVYFGATSILGEHYEHRIYLPLTGFFVFLGQLLLPFQRKATSAVLLLLALAYGLRTVSRFEVYSNDLAYVSEGIEDSPKNYVYHLLKGNALFNRKKLNESLVYYDEAIRLQPNRVQALANRANVYVMLREKELALADLNAALRIEKNPNLYLNRFNTFYVFKDYENALKDLETLKTMKDVFTLDIPPEVEQTLRTYEKERDAKKKLPVFTEAIARDPNNAELYVHRARALGYMKRWDEALRDLATACRLVPDNTQYRTFYTTLKSQLEQRPAAASAAGKQ